MKRGFTLVELSIVLVIIGLLIGGVLAAQSMIETTKIQMLIKNIGQYELAVNNFKTAFKYYPGRDPYYIPYGNPNDQQGWGAGGSGVACNGIYSNIVWQQSFAHLAQAQMITGSYLPYAPTSCGGTMNDIYYKTGGTIGPYTEINTYNTNKFPILLLQGNNTQLAGPPSPDAYFFQLTVDGSYVIPLEKKLGYSNMPGTALGFSSQYGENLCVGGSPCVKGNAGELDYYLMPLE